MSRGVRVSDLTEEALEDLFKALQGLSDDTLTIRPTQLLIRPDIIEMLAKHWGISFEEALAQIQEMVRRANDES